MWPFGRPVVLTVPRSDADAASECGGRCFFVLTGPGTVRLLQRGSLGRKEAVLGKIVLPEPRSSFLIKTEWVISGTTPIENQTRRYWAVTVPLVLRMGFSRYVSKDDLLHLKLVRQPMRLWDFRDKMLAWLFGQWKPLERVNGVALRYYETPISDRKWPTLIDDLSGVIHDWQMPGELPVGLASLAVFFPRPKEGGPVNTIGAVVKGESAWLGL